MEITETRIKGVKVLRPKAHGDNRGTFMELWNDESLHGIGIVDEFIQDNLSTSIKGVLRGVHTQIKFPQSKLVACLRGKIFDVAVDCRVDSPSFGKWHGEILSSDNHRQLYLPAGVAHGFLALEDAMVYMKVTTHYTAGDEIGFLWNDCEVGIEWPCMGDMKPILADKDMKWRNFKDMISQLSEYRKNA